MPKLPPEFTSWERLHAWIWKHVGGIPTDDKERTRIAFKITRNQPCPVFAWIRKERGDDDPEVIAEMERWLRVYDELVEYLNRKEVRVSWWAE